MFRPSPAVIRTPHPKHKHAMGPLLSDFEWLGLPYVFLIFVFVVLPVGIIFLYAFSSTDEYSGIITFHFNNFITFLSNPALVDTLNRSLILALQTTIITLIVGYPMAYIIARSKPKTQTLLILGITAPMWINLLMRILAWKTIFRMIEDISDIEIISQSWAAVVGMVYVYLPFMIIPIYTMLLKIEKNLIEASADLGATRMQTFWRVIFPLSVPGIMSGITMVLLPTATTLVVKQYLSNNTYNLIGNLIENYFILARNYGMGSAISIALALIIMVLVLLTRQFDSFSKLETKEG